MESMLVTESLGERIVKAARMAAAIHLHEFAICEERPERMLRQRVGIGRAGSCLLSDSHRGGCVTDDEPPAGTGRTE